MNQFNMKKLIPLIFLVCVLLSLITVSAAFPTDVDPLNKRSKKCPCSVAYADFDQGPVKGFVTFTQDEHGSTTVAGIFSKGFEDTNAKYEYLIVDDCGDVLHDLTKGLNVQYSHGGGTKSFRHTFDSFNLDCDKSGILFVETSGEVPLFKRHCKKLSKRGGGSTMVVKQNGGGHGGSKIGSN